MQVNKSTVFSWWVKKKRLLVSMSKRVIMSCPFSKWDEVHQRMKPPLLIIETNRKKVQVINLHLMSHCFSATITGCAKGR